MHVRGSRYQTSYSDFIHGTSSSFCKSLLYFTLNDSHLTSPSVVESIVSYRSLEEWKGGSSLCGAKDAAHNWRRVLMFPADICSSLKRSSATSNAS